MILQPGSLFAGYRIDRLLGSGAMGVVYQGHDLTLDRAVAIKVLSTILATPEDVERFRTEARVLARFSHPHILPIFTAGVEQGRPYLVTPLASGGALSAWLGKGPVRPENVVHVLQPIAEALDYAHAEGVVHRDVKPQNILLDARGRPLLADFGVAKLLDGVSALTATGEMLGTPAYMAPEYVHGTPVTPATDRYALAVVAYELLVGGQPYQGQTGIQQLLAHANGPLPQPRQANPALSPALEKSLLRGLARDPDQRFATAALLIGSIHAALAAGGTSGAGRTPSISLRSPAPPGPPIVQVKVDGTGDFAGLESAVRLAPAGSTVRLDAGVHQLVQPLTLRHDLTLVGSGKERTIIRCSGKEHVIRFEGPGSFTASDLSIEHQGKQVADTVIVVDGTVLFERCRFSQATVSSSRSGGGTGLELSGNTVGIVRDCEVLDNERHGICVRGESSPILEANTCDRNKDVGIVYGGNAAGTARQNICRENETAGMGVGQNARPALEFNTCERNQNVGIAYAGDATGTARKNILRENGTHGMTVLEQARPDLQGNISERNTEGGIAYAGTAAGKALQNRILENQYGIYIGEQARPQLEGNICEHNERGIVYSEDAGGMAQENRCNHNGIGISVGMQATPLLEGNTCERNKSGGIYYLANASGIARRNACSANEICGILVGEKAHPELEENTCVKNEGAGIGFVSSAAGKARRNICRENEQNGIFVTGQARPTLEKNTCERNAMCGIDYEEDASGTAHENICRENEGHGISVADQAQPILNANSCEQNTFNGIAYGGDAAGRAHENISRDNGQCGILVSERARPILELNSCERNTRDGIRYVESAAGTARRNVCRKNKEHGISIYDRARPDLEGNACQGNKGRDIARE